MQNTAATEATIIFTVLNGPKYLARYLLSQIKAEEFISDTAREIFRRVRALYLRKNLIPNAKTLIADPSLSEEARLFLQRKQQPLTELDEVEFVLEGFKRIARAEKALDVTANLAKALKDKDVEEAYRLTVELQQALRPEEEKTLTLGDLSQTKDVLETLDSLLKGKKLHLVTTGLSEFDEKSGGFPRGGVTLLSANTGGGKSTLALNLATNQARMGYKVLYVSLEMSKRELLARMASRLAGVPFDIIYSGSVTCKARKHLLRTKTRYMQEVHAKGGALELLCPENDVSIDDICAYARGKEFDVIYIDYINLLREPNKAKAKWENLGDSVRNAKIFAGSGPEEKQPAVVILVQYDKKKEQVRYSRAMEEHASLVWAWIYDETAESTNRVKVRQVKTRNQPRYDFWLKINFQFCRMESVAKDEVILPDEEPTQPSKVPSDKPPSPQGLDEWVDFIVEEEGL